MNKKQSALSSIIYITVLLLLMALTGCERFKSEPAVLLTNRAEFTAYAELFNTIQSDYKVSVVYQENPARAFTTGESDADIIIGPFLNNNKAAQLFQPLDKLLEEDIARSNFYPGILDLGQHEEKQVLLPVSFNLPLLLFPDGYEGIESFALSLGDIRELASDFPAGNSSRTILGYSPRWNPDAAFTHLRLFNTGFRETLSGDLLWNSEAMNEGITYMRNWIEEVNGGWEADTEFIEKFMHDPPYKLVAGGRILFAYSEIDSYYTIPSILRENLDFRWLSYSETIPAREDILLAGIPRGAGHGKAARAFLTWFYQIDTQTRLLEDSQYKRMRHFGLAGGFSSFQTINEIELPKHFPELVGHIPPASYISFPRALPDYWIELKHDAILPWITTQLAEAPQEQSLERSIERWRNQQPQL